ncbi:WecB/TagA/CpsF family glycosyltransferase [Aliiglaciecola lipolytica]|uniref:WecB/TagA/CpsF family glycosyltransferase n=1 Tax=Aliiglaciecola lipolytica TaxID=477689 RepID=UPI001C09825A|nr:WecB/TagA/CpsF family glycosyltransferase [Aliiglaciecola lipolytica]MBU2880302.1 WecB/TagA/CpsF family glycosyltransferase [Aliiglaciecola lipolytica]
METRTDVIKMKVNITEKQRTLNSVCELALKGKGSYMCVSNVHMCMEVFDSPQFGEIVNNADLVIPDGRPIYWAQKLLGHKTAEQVRGQDIMNTLCKASGQSGINIGFYGGSSDALLQKVIQNLSKQYPDIKITFSFSPPFRPLSRDEDKGVVQQINDAKVGVLFVGIGCPKQEIWMAEHKDKLNCVMLGVGAAFDFIAGAKRHAPRWMQKIGLEWLFRLCSEPKRLGHRYLKQNPRFIYYFCQQWLLGRKFS